ncbi:gustatory receptor for sugar taste 64f-like [Maniola jurtina]|uniref:gustatory receptor for sugar taste 64f-like n=1 Tax=Maniola jurtina TaxID=191418 RepID=UPI001E688A50|nr:gustatory receptor for sugar taste 64f-like [Maniola jurtina]
MHACLRQPMRLCRWAGLFPVEGLNKKTCSDLRLNLNSTYMIYHCLTLLGQFSLTSTSAYHFFTNNLSRNHLVDLVFYTTNLTTACFMGKLARNWALLIQKAGSIEKSVLHIQSGSNGPERYTRIAYFMLILSLVEHILSVIFKLKLLMSCDWENDTEDLDFMERFFTLIASFVFELTSYSHWKAVLFEVANIQSTFLWNFTDAMTMCVSLYLTSYFRVLNKLIEHQQRLKITRWEEIRSYYSDLVQLVQVVDSKMCYLILLSFFTNVFFICNQVFSLLNNNYPDFMDCHHQNFKVVEYYIYYCYSSIFLFVRATMTSLMAANLHTVATEPFYILQHVPASDYTIEVQRFIRQTKYTTTALSGLFFDVTRGMILTVIGTIIKYELVLLQFSVKRYEAMQ